MSDPDSHGRPTLVIGNRNYSSWSLRAWFFLKHRRIRFREIRLPLDTREFRDRIAEFSPSGRVPVLIHDERKIWDSLAICEYAAEQLAGVACWPDDAEARAHARSVAYEMHSGFDALRLALPFNCRALDRHVDPAGAASDIARIIYIWNECRSRYRDRGTWLFGRFSIADAMYAPVALRFRTYGVQLSGPAADWAGVVTEHPAIHEWLAAAEKEHEVIEREEVGRSQ